MGDNWDDDDFDVAPVQNMNIKASWEDEEEEEEEVKPVEKAPAAGSSQVKEPEKPGAAQAVGAGRKKKKNFLKNLDERKGTAAVEFEEYMDPEEARKHRQKLVEASDYDNLLDTFGDAANEVSAEGPKTAAEFEAFAVKCGAKLRAYEKSFHYNTFVKSLFREICLNVPVDDLKEINGYMETQRNTKIQKEKEKKGGKKKTAPKRAQVAVSRALDDDNDYGLDDDDFM